MPRQQAVSGKVNRRVSDIDASDETSRTQWAGGPLTDPATRLRIAKMEVCAPNTGGSGPPAEEQASLSGDAMLFWR